MTNCCKELRSVLEAVKQGFHAWDGNGVTSGHWFQLQELKDMVNHALSTPCQCEGETNKLTLKCGHSSYLKTIYGNCIACRANQVESDLNELEAARLCVEVLKRPSLWPMLHDSEKQYVREYDTLTQSPSSKKV